MCCFLHNRQAMLLNFFRSYMNCMLYLIVKKTVVSYTIGGVVFGLLFPSFAWIVECWIQSLPFNLKSIIEIHKKNQLIYIIDSAPAVLGLVFYFLGKKQYQLLQFNQQLNIQVANQDDIIKNNLAQLKNIKHTQSHVVRKPLANIIGLITLLNMTQLSEVQKEIVDQLNESSNELDDVIREVVQQSNE